MEGIVMEYVVPGSLLALIVGSLIAVKVELAKRPTFKDTNEQFKEVEEKKQDQKMCAQIHKSTDEKLACLPEMKDGITRLETALN